MKKVKCGKQLTLIAAALVVAIIIGVICAFVDFLAVNPQRTYSTAKIVLSYDDASSGYGPDGNRFNADEILTDGVITAALESQGLSEKYTVDDIRKCLSISGSYPANIIKSITSYDSLTDTSISRTISVGNYYPTTYSFVLCNDFASGLKGKKLNALLDAIVSGYTDNFVETYSEHFNLYSIDDIIDVSGHDYDDQVNIYQTKLNVIKAKAASLYAEKPDFTYNGKSFNDIALRCDSIIGNDISHVRSSITLNIVSKDKNALKTYYSYILRTDNYRLETLKADLETVTADIADYEKDSTLYISSGEQIIKIDGNSSATYDSLISKQISLSESIASLNYSISDYTDRLEKINGAASKTSVVSTVTSELLTIDNNVSAVVTDFSAMIKAYNERYIESDAISSTESKFCSGKIFSMSFIVELIKCVGPFCAIVILAAAVVWMAEGIREEKKRRYKA